MTSVTVPDRISGATPAWRSRLRSWARKTGRPAPLTAAGIALLVGFTVLALVVPLFAPDPRATTGLPLESPSAGHFMGTDHLGRDLLARTAAGARLSLAVGFFSVLLGLVLAVPLGMVAAYRAGSWLDDAVMRVLETVQALPVFVFAMFVIGLTGTGSSSVAGITLSMSTKVVLLLGISFLPYFARVARAQTLAEVHEDYVGALRVLGLPRRRVLGEVLVNVLPPVLAQGFLWIAIAIFAESALGFLALGVQPPTPTLGGILADSGNYVLVDAWWYSVLPGLVLVLAVTGFNLVGDALNDRIDRGGSQ
ncbi:ABC transporter permease [Yinghuangia seranimata]|uniref:ABC transporter permease n=1 Tax=Yinghuangia seranimata TaxID=408067 RepID=UPI00248C7E8D|nr:ABC transporter permease [Yinghuangia seranimata]MDI2124969.1 ABC transporter permease [Yinghuangia seranimata]